MIYILFATSLSNLDREFLFLRKAKYFYNASTFEVNHVFLSL